MGSGIDFAEDRRERARQRKLAAQKAQAEWEKTTHFTDEGYLKTSRLLRLVLVILLIGLVLATQVRLDVREAEVCLRPLELFNGKG